VSAHGQRHDQPGREAPQEDQQEQLAQVGHHAVARLVPHRLDVRELPLRQPLGGLAVDRPHVDREPRREADRPEARAPVHSGT
jgi:hypothetical protein